MIICDLRPASLKVVRKEQRPMHDGIPEELRQLPQWITWRLERRRGRLTKVPYQARSHKHASSTNPEHWAAFDLAVHASQGFEDDGIGFVFTEDSPYVGIDIDHCRNPETGEIAAWALSVLDALSTYTEISQSGTGIHAVIKGNWSNGRRCTLGDGGLEVYASGRYFALTGNRLDQFSADIREEPDLPRLLSAFFPAVRALPQQERRSEWSAMSDSELVRRAAAAKNGAKFERLMRGDISGYPESHRDPGHSSEAELALCRMLSFYTHDTAQIDRIIRQSGMIRAKWDRKWGDSTYIEKTILRALRR